MAGPPNDRELLIRIDERQAAVLNGQEEIKDDLNSLEGEVQEVKKAQQEGRLAHAECATLQNTRWEGHGNEHKTVEREIRRKSNLGDAAALALAGIAALLNINLKQ
jgi:hypothetical protein